MKYLRPAPLDAVLYTRAPTVRDRFHQHARRLEIALEQNDISEALREFNLMAMYYRTINQEPSK